MRISRWQTTAGFSEICLSPFLVPSPTGLIRQSLEISKQRNFSLAAEGVRGL